MVVDTPGAVTCALRGRPKSEGIAVHTWSCDGSLAGPLLLEFVVGRSCAGYDSLDQIRADRGHRFEPPMVEPAFIPALPPSSTLIGGSRSRTQPPPIISTPSNSPSTPLLDSTPHAPPRNYGCQ